MYIGPKARPEDIARVTIELGLDKPLPVQYLVYMGELLHGDLGTSIGTKRPVLLELSSRLPATLELLIHGHVNGGDRWGTHGSAQCPLAG